MADVQPTCPVCPVCNNPSAPGYANAVATNAPLVTDCHHLRLLALQTRKHAGEWEAR